MMAAKTPPDIRAEIKKLWNAGETNAAALGRRFGLTGITVRMIADRDYADRRRNAINARRRANPPPSECNRRQAPSLAKV